MNRDGEGTARNVQVQLHTSINYRQEVVGHTFLPTVQMTTKSAICCRSLPNKNWLFLFFKKLFLWLYCSCFVLCSIFIHCETAEKMLPKARSRWIPFAPKLFALTCEYFLFNFNISLRSDREFLLRFLFKFPIKVSFLKPLVTCEQLIAFNLHWSREVWSVERRCQLSSINLLFDLSLCDRLIA